MVDLELRDWSAWAPGLERREDWLAWAQRPTLPCGDGQNAAQDVPAMVRRRLDPVGRAAMQVALTVAGELPIVASVFVSRRGDSARTAGLLDCLKQDEPMSPTAFGLSVHNAVAAQFSMLRKDRGSYIALAAGKECVESGMLEIATQLCTSPSGSALLVMYEDCVPARYANSRDEPDARYAWAMRLSLPVGGGPRIRLTHALMHADSAAESSILPAGLRVLREVLAGSRTWTHRLPPLAWQWSITQ